MRNWILAAVAVIMAVSFIGLALTVNRLGHGAVTLGGATVAVDIARTPPQLQKGLSGRDSLPDGTGMLFQFPFPGKHGIWMKDMRFAIDIVWINSGKIVDIAPSVPPAGRDAALTVYEPRLTADMVLEVPAGFAAEHGLKIGDAVTIAG